MPKFLQESFNYWSGCVVVMIQKNSYILSRDKCGTLRRKYDRSGAFGIEGMAASTGNRRVNVLGKGYLENMFIGYMKRRKGGVVEYAGPRKSPSLRFLAMKTELLGG
jgi:hypothetical protein